jgi:hypothetical protein
MIVTGVFRGTDEGRTSMATEDGTSVTPDTPARFVLKKEK